MRAFLIATALLAPTACSDRRDAPTDDVAAAPSPAAPSADARAAKEVAQRYFDLLRAGDTAGAFALWSDDSSTRAGGVRAFAEAMRADGRLEGETGPPSAVRETAGIRYALVEAQATVTPAGRPAQRRSGVVMLKRPAAGATAWRIWGIDVRRRRCRAHETAKGLGCVPETKVQ